MYFCINFGVLVVPGPPADIKVVVSSPQSLLVSWLPPFEPNGVITKYNLHKRSGDGKQDHITQTVSSQHTNFEVKSVQAMTEYQFWVTAFTKIGEGQSSRVVSQVASQRGLYLTKKFCCVSRPGDQADAPRLPKKLSKEDFRLINP